MKHRLLLSAVAIFILHLGVSSGHAAPVEMAKGFPVRPPVLEMRGESDPTNQQSCDLMGQMSITYESESAGPPNFGLRITDPWGRKIGYDPRAPKVWQDLPLAEGFVECDENDDMSERQHCAAHIQICGPVSGIYKMEVLPTENGTYSIKVLSSSRLTRDQFSFRFTASRAEYRSEIRKLTLETLLLSYSREPGAQIKLGRRDRQLATTEERQAEGSSH